jgi:hypothetical protein
MLAPPEKPEARPEKPAAEDKRRTITLTNRSPVSILESQWPVIAEGSYHDEHPSGCEDLKIDFRVRRDRHGRCIVHGKFYYWNEGSETERTVRVGRYLARPHGDTEVALLEVGNEMKQRVHNEYMHRWVTIALDRCFAKLGAQVL